jgi:HTH-type transcriptional regulator / antitoxin HigA
MLITKNEKYIDLVNEFPPRPIKSHSDAIATQNVVDTLLDCKNILIY